MDSKPTFDCWPNTAVVEFLKQLAVGVTDHRDANDYGIMEISVEALQEALESTDLRIDDYVREALEADITWAKALGRRYIVYNCF